MNPTHIIILGGTGDLSRRKLLPALLDLYTRGELPKLFNIIGFARSDRTQNEYKDFVRKTIDEHHTGHNHDRVVIDSFCARIKYVQGSFDESDSYKKIEDEINNFDLENNVRSNRLFYLAVSPRFYENIFTDIAQTGLGQEAENARTYILVEKPFGSDYETAKKLDAQLASLYREDQIFRIDHYLAKEAVQNILSFRFSNNLLNSAWNNDTIKSVHITISETIDVGRRGSFYEDVGALRDVGQNHILQLLALVTMRRPREFSAKEIRSERARVLQSLLPANLSQVLRAQYEGYKDVREVECDSDTETYFELQTKLDLPEWKNVPFYMKSGKALDKPEVSIRIILKDVADGMFDTQSCETNNNEILLTIQPEQSMSITLNAKAPGIGFQLESRTMHVACDCEMEEITNSYEKVLHDAITGNQMLFTSTEEVLAAWSYISPIVNNWEDTILYTYKKGDSGPETTIIPTKNSL